MTQQDSFLKLDFYKGVHRWTLTETDYQQRLHHSTVFGSANKYYKINALQHFNFPFVCLLPCYFYTRLSKMPDGHNFRREGFIAGHSSQRSIVHDGDRAWKDQNSLFHRRPGSKVKADAQLICFQILLLYLSSEHTLWCHPQSGQTFLPLVFSENVPLDTPSLRLFLFWDVGDGVWVCFCIPGVHEIIKVKVQ